MPVNITLEMVQQLLEQNASLLKQNEMLKKLQDNGDFTELMVMQEEMKTLPFGDIWAEYCKECGVAADTSWYDEIMKYEKDVLSKR